MNGASLFCVLSQRINIQISEDLGNSTSNSLGDDVIQSFRSKRDSQQKRATGMGSNGGKPPTCLWWEREKRRQLLGDEGDGVREDTAWVMFAVHLFPPVSE